jgi:hypothetical protein
VLGWLPNTSPSPVTEGTPSDSHPDGVMACSASLVVRSIAWSAAVTSSPITFELAKNVLYRRDRRAGSKASGRKKAPDLFVSLSTMNCLLGLLEVLSKPTDAQG